MGGINEYAYCRWTVAAFNVDIFLFFLLGFFNPRGSQEFEVAMPSRSHRDR